MKLENIKEFNKNGYREFYSMQELVRTISRTLKVITWGARGWSKINPYLLRFRVSAHRHKGYVYVGVNGADLLDIWLTNLQGKVIKTFTDIYIEDFINVIDDEIENIPAYVR